MTAIEEYGLEAEGIYRVAGSTSHAQRLKALYDTSEWMFKSLLDFY